MFTHHHPCGKVEGIVGQFAKGLCFEFNEMPRPYIEMSCSLASTPMQEGGWMWGSLSKKELLGS